ncbi:MAG: hypothetical protein WCY89_00585 [Flavobacteriaceae bacterium]
MKSIKILFLLFLFVSCSSKQTTIEQYLANPVKFAKKEVKAPDGSYSILVPKNWETDFETSEYNDSEFLIFQAVSDIDEKGSFSGITVFETKSLAEVGSTNLETQYTFALEKYKHFDCQIISSGKTDIFGEQAYYIQTEVNNAELFDFFLKSKKEESLFYLINISTTKNENLKLNMAIMLNSLKTFKITQN